MRKHKSASEPYISFITFARNDDYAGGARKLYWSTRYLADQCDEAGLTAEAVIVEWNPPTDRDPLAKVLNEMPVSSNLDVRVITVPAPIHDRYAHAAIRPMHGAIAANVGLRRARGRFLLVKVADAFYPDSLIRFLAKRSLQPDRLYRAPRVDVEAQASEMLGRPRSEFLDYCAGHVALWNLHLPQPYAPFRLPDLFTNACGDFQLLARERWSELRGYWESSDVIAFETDSMFSFSAYAAGIVEERVAEQGLVYKISHTGSHGHRVGTVPTFFSAALLRLEALLGQIGIGYSAFFWLRVLLDYPPKVYRGIRKPVYERSLLRFKVLSLGPWLTRLKSRSWGLAGEHFPEISLQGRRRSSD